MVFDHPVCPERRNWSCLQHTEGVQVQVSWVTLPEKTKGVTQFWNTYMRLVVVTEYCKSISSQSGRQSQSDSVVLLICLKNSWAWLALRKGVCIILVSICVPLNRDWGTCMQLLHPRGFGAGTFRWNTLYTFLLLWTDPTYHGRQSDVVKASLIPHSNRQIEWEYLWVK